MEYSFPHYLLSKQSVDDRALNKDVFYGLKSHLGPGSVNVIEVGAGIGTMVTRLIEWGLFTHANYIAIDESAENIQYASKWIPRWASSAGLTAEGNDAGQIRLSDHVREVIITFYHTDVFEFVEKNRFQSDLLIAHAVLDLFPLPDSLPKLFSLTKDLAWLTVNFDGLTTFEPQIDPELDQHIEKLYHASMDARKTGGDSKSGRHLFNHLQRAGAKILAAGASDWVVHAMNGKYPEDEAYFLRFILHFVEETLKEDSRINTEEFAKWLQKRKGQVESGELVYIAHQMDFLCRIASGT